MNIRYEETQGRSLGFALELYEQTGNSDWLGMVENTLRNQYTKESELETNGKAIGSMVHWLHPKAKADS